MLEDIEEENFNPMNIVIDSSLSKRAQEESYQLQNKKLLEQIDKKRYGPEGKPVYEDIDEEVYCMMARSRKTVND